VVGTSHLKKKTTKNHEVLGPGNDGKIGLKYTKHNLSDQKKKPHPTRNMLYSDQGVKRVPGRKTTRGSAPRTWARAHADRAKVGKKEKGRGGGEKTGLHSQQTKSQKEEVD